MFFEFITLLMLFTFVVSQLLLTRYISKNLRKDREVSRVREERSLFVLKRIETVLQQVVQAEKTVIDYQIALDEKIGSLSEFIDEHHIYITDQHKQFMALAKSDMLIARRDELIRCKELKVSLERLVGVSTLSRQPPSPNDMIAIEALTSRIGELESILEGD